MSRYFRPIAGDPFWDSFWTSERSFFDTHFGSTITEEDFFPSSNYYVRRRPLGAPRSPLIVPHSPIMASQMHPLDKAYASGQVGNLQGNTSGGGDLIPANDKYQIMVDVSHFNPEEISVKMVDNAVIVTGKHEDKADNYGYVSRQFSRKYLLPADVEPESVTSTLSADGILSIQAPRKPLQITDDTAGRSVPIAISNQSLSPVMNLVPPQFPSTASVPPPPTSVPMSGLSGTSTITVERTVHEQQQQQQPTNTAQNQGSSNADNSGMNIPIVQQQQTDQQQQQPAPAQ
ncbi:Heat Shock Protein 20-like protein [Euroglyphus maynei]|uniref:Heat Shock Protein 20-like protein n=1 Tax=Euroglyphus maynei TaxID=6958 RepID=A0A1Y3BTR7_EURMA|nr:Heat Shock Protein 20-like protein [Euroglyphus maynei]